MKLRNASFGAAALVLSSGMLLGAGCGGSSTASRGSTLPLPASDAALLEFVPADAFVVGRLDFRQLRASGTWERHSPRFAERNAAELELLNGTDVVYFAVGAPMDLPASSRVVAANAEHAEAVEGEDGEVVEEVGASEEPAWAPMSRVLSGKVPVSVVVIEGRSSALCRAALATGENQGERAGLRYASKKGITIAVRGENFCLMTLEPVFERIVSAAGARSPVAQRLRSASADGSLGVASVALDLDSESFRQLVAATGPVATEVREGETDWAAIGRGIVTEVLHGMRSVSWDVSERGSSIESRVRVEFGDRDRGVMWREGSEMYMNILGIIAAHSEMPEAERLKLRQFAESTSVETNDDGYVVRNVISEELVASIFESILSEPTLPSPGAVLASDVHGLPYAMGGDAAETIARVEPLLSSLSELSAYDRSTVYRGLARAYRFVGRYDDARRVLSEARASESNADVLIRSTLSIEICALELELGRGAEAYDAANQALIDAQDVDFDAPSRANLVACRSVAMAMKGDVNGALTSLERDADTTAEFAAVASGVAKSSILMMAGRTAEARAVVQSICLGRSYLEPCSEATLIEASILARSATSVSELDVALTRLEERGIGNSPITMVEGERRITALRCEAESRLAASAPSTATTCEHALEGARSTYGDSSPRTLVAAMGVVRAARARRDTPLANTTLAEVDAILEKLGPNAPERAIRASLGGRARRAN